MFSVQKAYKYFVVLYGTIIKNIHVQVEK